ncbi:hypothetical protein SAMN04488074_14015 [Lentzea albidocapillata subsp. violacea]|uniref:Uncharacterized protein n=1 Tax=Lentzea albidocapillata subsp. violacea TaxID=128104 RepID=A0A1G9ZJI2_9PSEU|nr:hypothetical protein [Lentzea albidocapillata]SDN21489.1 hypothetical protein SAMN04488074_14015 [Lentzea albidocapillata subsp. violacea]
MRALKAALVGALCSLGWILSVLPAGGLYTGNSGIGAAFFTLLIAAPALVVVWTLVGWGLLKLARFSPAWPTAFVGATSVVLLMFVIGLVLIGMRAGWPDRGGHFVLALAGAVGYALPAMATADRRTGEGAVEGS